MQELIHEIYIRRSRRAFRHMLIPLFATVLLFVAAAIPIEFIDCRNRGLIAAFIALSTGVMSIAAVI